MKIEIHDVKLLDKLKALNNIAVNMLLKNNNIESLSPNPVVSLKSYFDAEGNNERGIVIVTKEDGRISQLKLSRVFKHVFNKDFYHESLHSSIIQQANNSFISLSNEHKFKVVDDVANWYRQENYHGHGTDIESDRTGTLWKSCMRNNMHNCELFFEKNPSIKLLIKLKEGSVVGRALLWSNVKDEAKSECSFKFMDRIYTVYDHDIEAFKSWAIENGYWRKEHQNYEDIDLFIDDKNSRVQIHGAYTEIDNYNPYNGYEKGIPYFDTFKYVNNNNTVSNKMNIHSQFEARDPEGLKIELHMVPYLSTNIMLNSRFLQYIPSINKHVKHDECLYDSVKNEYVISMPIDYTTNTNPITI